MTLAKEETSCIAESTFDLISAVKGLNGRNSNELHKMLRETEDLCISYRNEEGLPVKIDVEKLAGFLPLHLIAVLMSSDRDEAMFRYMLSGLRLLHTLCDLAPRNTKLEQVLLDDVKLSEQMLDLVFYLLIVLGSNRQATHGSDGLSLLHATLVASSLYLLHGCISSQRQDLVQVLLAHPKVDIFMDVSFGSVHNAIRSLQMTLLSRGTDVLTNSGFYAESAVNYHSLQAEASLQFLHSLCKQKPFREHLVKSKELCGNGGVLMLGLSVLLLTIPPQFTESSTVVASISRMKAKILSILLYLFEAESVSFLDEVASAGNLHLAKSIATEVLDLLRTTLSNNSRHLKAPSKPYPMGFVHLNAMRLIELFTDDSNFRWFFTQHFSEVLSAIFSLSHGDFLSMWCSFDLPSREEDAALEYDHFAAAGWILNLLSSPNRANASYFMFNLLPNNLPVASYIHRRTSNLIKMIANLHCFVPNICKEQEKHVFIHNFTSGLRKNLSKILPGFLFTSDAQRSTGVCRNLCSLLSYAETLIPKFLNEEDLQLLRAFLDQFQTLIRSEIDESQVQEAQSTGGCSSLDRRKEPSNVNNGNGNPNEGTSENSASRAKDITIQDKKEEIEIASRSTNNDQDVQNVETNVSDTSCTRGKNSVDRSDYGELPKSIEDFRESGSGEVKDDEKVEKQRRKRKRSIMNDKQMAMIERALLNEPDMQRNSASIQTWADKLCHHGPEVTSSQLRNWLNNRKAKLARASKQAGPPRDASIDLPDSPGKETISTKHQSSKGGNPIAPRNVTAAENSKTSAESIKRGHYVVLLDEKGKEIGRGKVKSEAIRFSTAEDVTEFCVVDVVELKCDKKTLLPNPEDEDAMTFEEAESKFGRMKVIWDLDKMYKFMKNELD